ncbi:MAG: hypothetical protein PF447_03970 [Spirochaetaceae bacterium]|jgi:hypothetical protein|nr:hypothetical protein [Spirochaetaceae bacterium]
MKQTPANKKALTNMVPGIITAEGFLGDDHRALTEIIAEDQSHFKRENLDWEEVAEKLQYFMDQGRKGLGEPITVDENWIVRTDEARGHLACPWEDGVFRKINAILKNKKNSLTLFYTELTVHLLKEHQFLEGKGSTFRLEPHLIKEVLYG